MPFTPFHFGLGLATKATGRRRFSLTYFLALQVAIDLESLYNLILDRYPVHRFLHTFVGATLLAIVSTLVVFPVTRWWSKSQSRLIPRFIWLMITALFATWSHVVLDGIMHRDAQPFWPYTARNPLLSLVSLSVLHLVLVGLGMIGLIVIAFQWSPGESPEKP